jgi:hypothetical protein
MEVTDWGRRKSSVVVFGKSSVRARLCEIMQENAIANLGEGYSFVSQFEVVYVGAHRQIALFAVKAVALPVAEAEAESAHPPPDRRLQRLVKQFPIAADVDSPQIQLVVVNCTSYLSRLFSLARGQAVATEYVLSLIFLINNILIITSRTKFTARNIMDLVILSEDMGGSSASDHYLTSFGPTPFMFTMNTAQMR